MVSLSDRFLKKVHFLHNYENYPHVCFLSLIGNIYTGYGCTLCHLKLIFGGDFGDKPSAHSRFFSYFRAFIAVFGL